MRKATGELAGSPEEFTNVPNGRRSELMPVYAACRVKVVDIRLPMWSNAY